MSRVKIIYENFAKICRFCLKSNLVLKPLFEEYVKIENEDDGALKTTLFWNKTGLMEVITSLQVIVLTFVYLIFFHLFS